MDAASVLEQYTQDLSNLPAELTHLLTELRDKDMKYYETRKRIQQRDNQLHKTIKQFGSLHKSPKEEQIYAKIDEDFEKAYKLQEEKCILSNTALFLITKYLTRLEADIESLENEGLLAPAELLEQEASLTSALSSTMNSMSLGNQSAVKLPQHTHKRAQSRKLQQSNSVSRNSTPSFTTPSRQGQGGNLRAPSSDESTMLDSQMIPLQSSLTSIAATGNIQTPHHHSHHHNHNHISSSSSPQGDTMMSDQIVPRRNKNAPPPPANLVLASSLQPSTSIDIAMGPNGQNGAEEDELYCFCRQVSFGNMIACDNANCKFEWFHYDCVGLKEPPQGTWYCPDCAKLMANKKGRKRK